MFFFWGPFFFVFPALALYYVLRHIFGQGYRGNQTRFFDEYPQYEDLGYQGRHRSKESRQAEIYKLAYTLGGKITVSDIVIETGETVNEAEELIQSMVDNQHIRMEVKDDGLVVYEFPEIIARFREKRDSDKS